MKKTILFLGLALVMSAFTSCTKDEATNTGGETVGTTLPCLVAEMPEVNSDTRIYLKDGEVVWKANDAVALFNSGSAGNKIRYNLTEGADTRQGTFAPDADQSSVVLKPVWYGKLQDGTQDLRHVIVAPYTQLTFSFSENFYYQIGAKIPTNQTYRKGTFDGAVMPMMAVVQQIDGAFTPLKFKYMNSLIRIPLKAAEASAFDKIILSTDNENDPLAGDILYEFTTQIEDRYKDEATRDQIFLDLAYPMDSKKSIFFGATNVVTLQGNIALNPTTAEDIYFGIMPVSLDTDPSTYACTLTFCREDGAQLEKKISKTTTLVPGDVANLPELTLNVPYMPVVTEGKMTVNGADVDVYKWTPNAALVASQTVNIYNDEGDVLCTLGVKSDTTCIAKETIMAALDKVSLPIGEEAVLGVAVKATFKDASGQKLNAVSSAPVELLFAVPIPELDLKITIPINQTTQQPISFLLQVSNFDRYTKVEYAYVVKKDATAEDFAQATFKPMYSSALNKLYADEIEPGDYTYMFKAYVGEEVEKTGFLKFNNPERAAPTAPDVMVEDVAKIVISNYDELVAAYAPTSTYVIWKEYNGTTPWTLVSDFDNLPAAQKVMFDNYGQIYLNDCGFPGADGYGNNSLYYSLLVVMESTSAPDGSGKMTTIISFHNKY